MRLCVVFVCSFFFFQAEDGIRDLVRSRGLGDVYKRQPPSWDAPSRARPAPTASRTTSPRHGSSDTPGRSPVSYTHLTLPTSDLV